MTGSERQILLVYGTQTGQSKAIAEAIAERCLLYGIVANLHCLGKFESEFSLENARLVVIVTSSTGDGEPPETVRKFWRTIRRKTITKEHLSGLKYALLGLGDSNYSSFCNFPKSLDKRLQEIGATHFVKPGFADDGVGLEIVVEPWIDELLPALCLHFGIEPPKSINTPTNSAIKYSVKTQGEIKQGNTSVAGPQETDVLSRNGKKTEELSSAETHIDAITVDTSRLSVKEVISTSNSLASEQGDQPGSPIDPSVKPSEQATDHSPVIGHEWILNIPVVEVTELTLPISPTSFLELELISSNLEEDGHSWSQIVQNGHKLPFAASPVYQGTIHCIKQLTEPSAVKTTLQVELCCQETVDFKSGDTFGVLASNDEDEVQWLFSRMGIDKPNQVIKLNVKASTEKRKVVVPEYITNPSTLLDIFTTCVDIRPAPKKAFLKTLAGFCSNDLEKKKLLFLSSKEGADFYMKLILEAKRNLLDVLYSFASCKPTVESLLENLPRLLPRAYSVACAGGSCNIRFAFNVIDLPPVGSLCCRQGLVTGKLDKIFKQTSNCSQVKFYHRSNQNFRMPEDSTAPLILIGPGTGVAPFIGFLEDRLLLQSNGNPVGQCLLFFGNRHRDKDFLYRNELDKHLAQGSLSQLFVCFSRDADLGQPKYVTDLLRQQTDCLADLILNKSAYVYVCGDAKNMSKDVLLAFTEILQGKTGMTDSETTAFIKKLRESKRYREDVWT